MPSGIYKRKGHDIKSDMTEDERLLYLINLFLLDKNYVALQQAHNLIHKVFRNQKEFEKLSTIQLGH